MATKPQFNPSKIAIPAQPYTCRVESYTFKTTKNGDPMSVIKCAIAAPESFTHEGFTVPIAGRQFQLNLIWNDTESWGTLAAFDVLEKLGYSGEKFEPDNTKSTDSAFFQNLYFRATLKSEANYYTTDGSYYNVKATPEAMIQLDSDGNKLLRDYRIICNGQDVICAVQADGQPY